MPAEDDTGVAQADVADRALNEWDAGTQWEPRPAESSAEVAAAQPFLPTRQEWAEEPLGEGAQVQVTVRPDIERWQRQFDCAVTAMQTGRYSDLSQQPDSFLSEVHAALHPTASMKGGQLSQFLPVWRRLAALAPPGGDREQADRVLKWIQHGAPLQFCHTQDPQKSREPNHARKRAGVARSLAHAGYTPAQIGRAMSGKFPQPVAIGNRLPDARALEFARGQVQKDLRKGVLAEWPQRWRRSGRRPWLMLPLSVAEDAYAKQRLIFDARYLNLFLQYLPFNYDRLQHLLASTQAGQFIVTDDLKSGYHHLAMAAEFWGLLGFELDGKWLVFKCLPFGVSQACWIFAQLLQTVYRLPRSLGWPLVGVVDDCGMTGNHRVLAQRSWAMALLKVALGLVHNREKSCFWPVQEAKLLGFLVRVDCAQLLVPEHKLQRFEAGVKQLRSTTPPDQRLLASLRGQLASFAPAIGMAPLLARWLRAAAEGDLETSDWGAEFLHFWAGLLPRVNGRSWQPPQKRAVQLRLFADTSEAAYGAHSLGGQWRLSRQFSQTELARMQAGGFSSTEREVRGYLVAAQGLARAQPRAMEGCELQIWGDNQAAVADCQRMRGTQRVFPAVLDLYRWAADWRVQLSFVWVPREDENLRLADALSKVADPSDWRLSRTIAQEQIFSQPGFQPPDIDCFASYGARMCSVYFSAEYDGVSAGVDGMLQPWNRRPGPVAAQAAAEEPVCYWFPPQALLRPVLQKVAKEGARGTLVCPASLPVGLEQLLQPILVKSVKLQAPHSVLVKPTCRVPRATAAGGWKTPLQACWIDGRGRSANGRSTARLELECGNSGPR